MAPYKDADAVRVFKGFKETFQGQKFDFISVDAPLGSDMKQYSRIDILSILPNALMDSFTIMVDDYMRVGEQRMVQEMHDILHDNNIGYSEGKYDGTKRLYILTSENYKFLCSL